jgi:hypothetical protein
VNLRVPDFYGSNGSTVWRTDSVGDELYFIARSEPSSAKADICEVGYYLTNDNILRRFYVTDDAGSFDYDFSTPSAGVELALNVTALNFRYLNHSNVWEIDNIWDSQTTGAEKGTLPKAVEIIIKVQDDKQIAKEREFRTVVYLPGNNQ